MFKFMGNSCLALFIAGSIPCAFGQDLALFNGKDLEGWTFEVGKGEEHPQPVEKVWVVKQGLLISTGACDSFLKHTGDFADYVLTLEWRSMRQRGSGVSVGGLGSLFVHVSDESGSFGYPKSVEITLFTQPGTVYLRDVEPFSEKKWAFRTPDFADDVDNEMGEWNRLKLICRGHRLTVFVNGTAVNQVEGLNRAKGSIALQSQRGTFPAPSYYRNIRVQPLSDTSAQDEQRAKQQLARTTDVAARRKAAEEAERRESERQEKMREEEMSRQWDTIDTPQDIDFAADALQLPYPQGARELDFDATFGDIELVSGSSLSALSKFYRTEMARRGWKEVEKDRDEDSVKVTFAHGQAQVELRLDQESDGVKVRMDCRGLSFQGTDDPARLAALGFAQPRAYLFLQKELKLPGSVRDLEFDGGDRCLFKCDVGLQDTFANLGQQLRSKGYRETRRPIVNDDRRYTEFAKGRVTVSVNVFAHEGGSRAILTYKEK